ELPGAEHEGDQREDHDHHQRGRQQEQVGEAADQEVHHRGEEVEQPGDVLLEPVDAGVDPVADREAGHEGVVGVHRASPPRRSSAVGASCAASPGPPGSTGPGGGSTAGEELSPSPITPSAVSRVTRGITPANRPSSSTTTSGASCCADLPNSSATGVSWLTTAMSCTSDQGSSSWPRRTASATSSCQITPAGVRSRSSTTSQEFCVSRSSLWAVRGPWPMPRVSRGCSITAPATSTRVRSTSWMNVAP